MTIHIGTAMTRRRVIEDDASRDGRDRDAFQQEALRIGRFVATVLLIAFTCIGLVAIVWSL